MNVVPNEEGVLDGSGGEEGAFLWYDAYEGTISDGETVESRPYSATEAMKWNRRIIRGSSRQSRW